jgi:hypothetical protein
MRAVVAVSYETPHHAYTSRVKESCVLPQLQSRYDDMGIFIWASFLKEILVIVGTEQQFTYSIKSLQFVIFGLIMQWTAVLCFPQELRNSTDFSVIIY